MPPPNCLGLIDGIRLPDAPAELKQLLDAKSKIDAALSIAQNGGTAKIGDKVFSYEQLSRLATENDELLTRNAELQGKVADFKDKVAAIQGTATSVMDTLVTEPSQPDYPWFDMPGLSNGLGIVPGVAVPISYVVGAGALLATAIYLFIGNVRSHISAVAGNVGGNFVVYGGIALLLYFLAKKRGIF